MISPKTSSDFKSIYIAKCLLENFVKNGITLYGKTFAVYNVHSLLHMHTDVRSFGSLDICSAFRFENYLHTLKNKVKGCKNPN